MTHFTDRASLISWLYGSVKGYRAVNRAMDEGSIENLGHFRELPPLHRPGFIVRLYSTHGREFLLAVTNKTISRMGVYIIDEVTWDKWDGFKYYDSNGLFSGDRPEIYRKLREEALDENEI